MTHPVKLLMEFHAASGLPFQTSTAWANALYQEHVSNPDKIAIVRGHGILLGAVGQSPLGPFKVAHEVAWWVSPGARGTGLEMLREYETWAWSKGVFGIEVKSLAVFPDAGKIYERAGFTALETSWVKWQSLPQ